MHFRVVNDYEDTGFANFANEYLRENEKFSKTVFACSYGAMSNILSQTIMVENHVTLSP